MSNDYWRGNGAAYWLDVASFMENSDLTPKTMSEIIAIQVMEAKSVGVDNVEIPVDFAWQIAGLLRDAKNKKGRRRHSFFEKERYHYFIRCGHDYKKILIEAGMKPGEAHEAAVQWVRHANRLTNMVSEQTVSRAIYRARTSKQRLKFMRGFSVAPSAGGPDFYPPEFLEREKSDG
jgi:hypothetical protein